MRSPLSFLHFFNSDRYQYTESEVLFHTHQHQKYAVFEYFFRHTEDGGYAVVSGTTDIAKLVDLFNKTSPKERRSYFAPLVHDTALLDYLCTCSFSGHIFAMQEGELAYPYEPVIVVEGDMMLAKILETPLLNLMNFQMTIASKTNRIRRAIGEKRKILAFGTRRAHGFDAGLFGTKAALIAGCDAHSSLSAEFFFQYSAVGTMSHSYIQSFGFGAQAELAAFQAFVQQQKNHVHSNLCLLIDTYDVLNIGLKNAITCFRNAGIDDTWSGSYGVRIDSGDLAYLSKQIRKTLDAAGLYKAQITLTNGLDEVLIENLILQGACFDAVGVGDAIAVNRDNPCFGGVYKLACIDHQPVMKISADINKTTTPQLKEVFRIYCQGLAAADLVCIKNAPDADRERLRTGQQLTITSEHNSLARTTFAQGSYTTRSLLVPLMLNGQLTEYAMQDYKDIIDQAKQGLQQNMLKLSPEHLRLTKPHFYKVDLSTDLYNLKLSLLKQARLHE